MDDELASEADMEAEPTNNRKPVHIPYPYLYPLEELSMRKHREGEAQPGGGQES